MDINIGEMSLGDILARGMKLLFKRLPYFYIIQLMVAAPTLTVQLSSPFLPPAMGLLVFLSLIILAPIGSAAMLRIIVQEYLDGQVSLSEAFQFAMGRFLPLLGTSILMGLLLMLGFLLCCLPAIYMAIIWCMMSQVVVVENRAGMEALSRSKSLVQGYFGHVFALLLLLGLATFVVNGGLAFGLAVLLPYQQVVVPAGQNPNPFAANMVITNYMNYAIVTIVTTLVSIFVQAYTAICVTLLYFDLRNRKEGYDVPTVFANIAAWRQRSWDDDADAGVRPPSALPPATGIKEPGTTLPPQPPPETGIQEPGAGPPPA